MRFLLLLVLALIGYGSLYPFEFIARPDGLDEALKLFTQPSLRMQRGDLIGNLLLFVPHGFLSALAARSTPNPGRTSLRHAAIGILVAVTLQIAQIWLPSRVPALGDAIINTAGLALGLLFGMLALRVRPALADSRHAATFVPLLLMLAWVAYQWFPLVPTLDWQNVKNALKPLLLAPQVDPVRIFATVVSWAAFFKLWDLLATGPRSAVLQAFGGITILSAKLVILGASISLSNVIGLGLALVTLPWLHHSRSLPALAIAILFTLFVSGLQPFVPSGAPDSFAWMPFTGMLEGSMGTNLANLLEKTFLYGAAVLFMHRHGARPIAAAIAVALCLATIEAAQLFLPGRTAESTDPVLALLLGVAIAQLSRRPLTNSSKRR